MMTMSPCRSPILTPVVQNFPFRCENQMLGVLFRYRQLKVFQNMLLFPDTFQQVDFPIEDDPLWEAAQKFIPSFTPLDCEISTEDVLLAQSLALSERGLRPTDFSHMSWHTIQMRTPMSSCYQTLSCRLFSTSVFDLFHASRLDELNSLLYNYESRFSHRVRMFHCVFL